MSTFKLSCLTMAALVAAAAGAFAQLSPLSAAKDLYSAAAYEDALSALNQLGPQSLQDPATAQTVREYRALCLLALGKSSEAEQAVEQMVRADPTLKLAGSDAPPRLVEMYQATRRRVLPAAVLQQYAAAKAKFEAHDYAAAAAAFERLMALLDDPDVKGASDAKLTDVSMLASGFLQLARRQVPPPAPAAPARSAAEETPAPATKPPEIVPPQTVRQRLPSWQEPRLEGLVYTGIVEVSISETGDVVGLKFVKSIHPAYDRLLEQAARSWKYVPATEDGRPSASSKILTINVSPHR